MAIVANRYWIVLSLLVGAIVCYSVGFAAGFALLLAAGMLLELAFWLALIKRNRPR